MMKNQWNENGKTLGAGIIGNIVGERIDIRNYITILVPGKIEHSMRPGVGANVERLVEKNGEYRAVLYAPVEVNGKSIGRVCITAQQYTACREWLATTEASVRAELQAELDARPEITIEWGNGHDISRGHFIDSALKAAGIEINVEWDRYFTHKATLPRQQWKQIEADIEKKNIERDKQRDMELKESTFRIQLWEPCEHCGAEPCYATPSGHLCEKCAG